MAGSAVNLGIGGGMFSPGLGPNQQALVDSLKRRSMALGKPAINLEDPAALRAEAARLQQQGDVQGAMQMLQRAQNLEKHQQQQSDRLRDQKATLDAGGAAITKQAGATAQRGRAFQQDMETKGQVMKRLAELGMKEEMAQLQRGTLTPKAADQAIRNKLSTDASAAAKSAADGLADESQSAERAAQAAQLREMAEGLTGADAVAAENRAKAVENGGSFDSAMTDVLKRMSEDEGGKYAGVLPSKKRAREVYREAAKVNEDLARLPKEKQFLAATAIENIKKANAEMPLEAVYDQVAQMYSDPESEKGILDTILGLLRFDATPDEMSSDDLLDKYAPTK